MCQTKGSIFNKWKETEKPSSAQPCRLANQADASSRWPKCPCTDAAAAAAAVGAVGAHRHEAPALRLLDLLLDI